MALHVDGEFKEELVGVVLPDKYTVKVRNWNYNNYIPAITDPFNPFTTEGVMKEISIPLPQVRQIIN